MKKNIIALCLVVSLAAVSLVFGTMAYFSDKTDEKINAFTVGNVDITLNEEHWNEAEEHSLVPTRRFAKDPTVTVAADSQDCYLFLEVSVNKYEQLIDLMGIDAYAKNITDKDSNALSGDYDKANRKEFVQKLLDDSMLRHNVLNRWFTGISYGDWTIMNADEILKAFDTPGEGEQKPTELSVVLGYGENNDSTKTLTKNQSVRFMTKYGMPAEITQDMLAAASFTADDSSKFTMTFTAYAIQTPAIDNMGKAYDIIKGKF
ncbi:MAG: SipW-dependent-type signal peptide-containing protein, partial [Acutalibacteraceae bacterium]